MGHGISLEWAVAGKHKKITAWLLKHGNRYHFQSALHNAVESLDLPMVQLLLPYLAENIDTFRCGRSRPGTLLEKAARMGHIPILQLLLDAGANINYVSHQRNGGPLFMALINGHNKAALFLLEKGAQASAVTLAGFSTLHCAISRSSDLKMIDALLAHGADPHYRPNKLDIFDRSWLPSPGTAIEYAMRRGCHAEAMYMLNYRRNKLKAFCMGSIPRLGEESAVFRVFFGSAWAETRLLWHIKEFLA